MDEKDKQIENLQKKLKFSATDHRQNEEILVFHNKCNELNNEVLDLNSKLLQVIQEKEEMIKKGTFQIVPLEPQLVDTEELTRSLAQVSLKDKDITNLKEEKKALE